MIASLGMYDRAETAAANDALWSLVRDNLRARGVTAPDALTRGEGAYWPAWQSPDLLLSQTCGLPFRSRLHADVTLVGTPDFGVQGCAPGFYRSVLIARRDDPRQTAADFAPTRLAVNDTLSQSGWAAVFQHFQDLGLTTTPALITGSHRASATAVAQGQADFAAIDAVTWRLLTRHDDFTAGLRIFAQTDPTPGLPLITAKADLAKTLFAVVAQGITDLDAGHRSALGLRGVVRIPASAYLAVPIPPALAMIDGIS